MRTYPKLTEQATSRDFIEAFGGYNHNLRIGENEFYDMKNLSSSHYPILSTRYTRGLYGDYSIGKYNPVGFVCNEKLWLLLAHKDTNELWLQDTVSNKIYDLGVAEYDAYQKRTLVSSGAYIIIMPDKKIINLTELPENSSDATGVAKNIEALFRSPIALRDDEGNILYYLDENGEKVPGIGGYLAIWVKYTLCKADGTAYTPNTTSDTEPTGVANGHMWLDTSVIPNSLKIYSSASSMWTPVASTYIKIESSGIGVGFEVGDAVRLSDVIPDECESINFPTGKAASIIQAKGDDYIVVIGMLKDKVSVEQTEPITVQRVMPTMDFMFESNNRLWGCRYGENRDGKIVNEIYASKLGDFTNWEYFAGTSQDSYMASLGADGEFTGGISYLGKPLFFRQNCIHTIYGSYPAQYQLQTTECRGVQRGCHNSLVAINGTLYYKSLGGVSAYTGSLPMEIGSALGEEGMRYTDAYGGVYRDKYYLGMYDAKAKGDTTWLYVYDTEKGLWHKEDEYNGREFWYCELEDRLYYFAPTADTYNNPSFVQGKPYGDKISYKVRYISGENCFDATDNASLDWFAETGVIGCSSPDKKYISRMSIRLSTKIGARVYVFAEYDSSGTWEQIGAITSPSLNTFTFPIRPKRCDHFRLRIMGTDEAKIYSISKTLEQGSDI